jgi:ADP-ribose pyrophosphatase
VSNAGAARKFEGKWGETMSKRRVQRGAQFELVTETVELPNGRRVALDLVRHPGAAAIVPFLDKDRILMIRQYRFATGGEILEIPAGKLDPGETPETCAARELLEETGYRAGRLEKLGAIWTSPGFTDEVIHLYSAFDLEAAEQQLEPDEIIELVPMSLREALETIRRSAIFDAKSATALLLAEDRQRQKMNSPGAVR